jgi:hypothetical protein
MRTLATDREAAAAASLSVTDLVQLLLERLVADSAAELARAEGNSGRVLATLELSVVHGKPRWHSVSLHFAEHQQYGKDSIVG